VIVIGAGMGGLATACYAQMSGMQTRVFEKHVLPGGCCTAWSRGGYVFDYCIDWLIGTGAGNEANQIWRELGALDGKTVRDFEVFNRVIGPDGRSVDFYNDPDLLEPHLLEISPRDAKLIRGFCRDLRRFMSVELYPFLTPSPLQTPRERLRTAVTIARSFRLFWRTGATQMHDFCSRLEDPLLRRAFPNLLMQDHEVFPLLPYLFNLAAAHKRNAGFPQGGSLGLARSVEERYLGLGGEVFYRSRVTRVLVEDGRAVGVELKGGQRHYADHVVAACDGMTTLKQLLDGRYTSPTVDELYEQTLRDPGALYPGGVTAFVGIEGDLPPDTAHSTTYLLSPADAARLPGVLQDSLVVKLRSGYSDGFAPAGRSVVQCNYFSDYAHWKELRSRSRREYRAEKQKVADFVCEFLERQHPGVGARIELVDVASPTTTERYTGNFEGSILAWKAFTPADGLIKRLIDKDRMRLPGLAGFSMAGQWVGGGGLIRAASTGRFAAQYLCEEFGLPFRAWESTCSERWHPSRLGPLPQLDAWTARPAIAA
jgi:phytoene dehydrogenase-like protein